MVATNPHIGNSQETQSIAGRISGYYFRAETRFFIMLLMSLSMFAIASSIGSGWVLFLSACILSCCFLSILLPYLTVRFVSTTLFGPQEINAGDPMPLALKLECKPWIQSALRWLVLSAMLSKSETFKGQEAESLLLETAPSQAVPMDCPGLKRRIRKMPSVGVETSFPFGMVWCKAVHESEQTLAVLPRTEAIEGKFLFRLRSGVYVPGEAQDTNSGFQSCSSRGVRQYVRGDSRRFIHWALSARHGQLMVKEMEHEGLPAFDVALDMQADWKNPEQLELAITAAATLLQLGHSLGIHPDLFILESTIKLGDSLDLRSADINQQLLELASLEYSDPKTKRKNEQAHSSDPIAFEGRQKAIVLISPLKESGSSTSEGESKTRNSVYVLRVAPQAEANFAPVNSNEFILCTAEDLATL